jgi:hypothetical protein
MNKHEVSSPTVAIEALMLTCIIDAAEQWEVATVDIPGAFMHADMDEEVFIKMEGAMADLLVRIDKDKYGPYITQGPKGKSLIYLQLAKALYGGTLQAALLFWKKLSGFLQSIGFTANPCDGCVMNKTIDGKSCTVVWHVDDLKISHANKIVVTDIVRHLEDEFGDHAPLTQTFGKLHDYLGMKIDYSSSGQVRFSMNNYIQEMLDALPDEMSGHAVTPATSHLFDVNPDTKPLDAKTSEFFHHNVAKLLFLCKRVRPDIQTAVAFLCTHVKNPDGDDLKKLTRVMKYLRSTIDLCLTLQAKLPTQVNWWVDASFATHPDMRGHTGAMMSLGKGAAYASSTRQKLNTRSSTESELVGVYDILPQIIWTQSFLEGQGYTVTPSTLYQDNKSTMLLETNGQASSSKRTRHINIRYFYVHDRVKSNDVNIKYCPTDAMLADFFTKPLQGSRFEKLRDMVLNNNQAE